MAEFVNRQHLQMHRSLTCMLSVWWRMCCYQAASHLTGPHRVRYCSSNDACLGVGQPTDKMSAAALFSLYKDCFSLILGYVSVQKRPCRTHLCSKLKSLPSNSNLSHVKKYVTPIYTKNAKTRRLIKISWIHSVSVLLNLLAQQSYQQKLHRIKATVTMQNKLVVLQIQIKQIHRWYMICLQATRISSRVLAKLQIQLALLHHSSTQIEK